MHFFCGQQLQYFSPSWNTGFPLWYLRLTSPPWPTRNSPPRSRSDHTTYDIPREDTAPFHLFVTLSPPIPFIGFGCVFSDSIFSSDLTAVGALGFCELYSSIDLICAGVAGVAAAGAEAAAALTALLIAAALTALLIAATVGEGAKDWFFGSQLWGPTVQPGILLNSSQSYTRLALTPLRDAYFLQQDQPFDASWNTGGAV